MAQRVDAPGGRALAVYEDGEPNGAAVIVHHGTPDSGLLYRNWVALAQEQGIRLIGYDRNRQSQTVSLVVRRPSLSP